jgi:hypothetical protein
MLMNLLVEKQDIRELLEVMPQPKRHRLPAAIQLPVIV